MRIRVAIAVTFAGLVVAGCGTASQVASQGGSVSGPAVVNGAKARPVVFDCSNRAVVRPGTYVLACADGGSLLIHLSWTRWTSEHAVATGIHQLHDCTPDCATGHQSTYAAHVVLSDIEVVNGTREYTRYTVTFTGQSQRPDLSRSLTDQQTQQG